MRKLALAGVLALGLSAVANGQSVPESMSLPKVPDFYRTFDVSVPVASTEGEVYWKSKKYYSNDGHIREIRGHCDLDVKLLMFGLEKIYVGFITRINYEKNTIETIVYNNGSDKELNEYEKQVAREERIDTLNVDDISKVFADYNHNVLIDLESGNFSPLNNALGFQEGYFGIPKKLGNDTVMNISYKDKMFYISTDVRKEGNERYVYIDLTTPDPENPGERINIMEKVNWLKIYLDEMDMPRKVVAEMNGPLGIDVDATAEYKK